MTQPYLRINAEYLNTLVFYRMRNFFELFLQTQRRRSAFSTSP